MSKTATASQVPAVKGSGKAPRASQAPKPQPRAIPAHAPAESASRRAPRTLSHVQITANLAGMFRQAKGRVEVIQTTIRALVDHGANMGTGLVKIMKSFSQSLNEDNPYKDCLKLWGELDKEEKKTVQDLWNYQLKVLGLRGNGGKDPDAPLALSMILGGLRTGRHYGTKEEWKEVSALVSKLSRTNISEPKEA